MSLKRCSSCNTINGMKMMCKFCETKYCLSCLMPEIHKCENIDKLKESCKLQLEKDLVNNKCVKRKIEKI